MRKICVFTGSRAEYGLLRALLFKLCHSPEVELQLLVAGTHCAESKGHTLDEIIADGFSINAAVEMVLDSSTPFATCAGMGIGTSLLAKEVQRLKPDICVVLGDRYEAFCIAAVCTVMCIPICHIHGGESTRGAFDEAFRHSITKMSHLHFTSCEMHRKRVIQLGEQPDRVWNLGALGVENVLSISLLDEGDIRNFLQLPPDAPYVVCTFHPVTLELNSEAEQLRNLLSALAKFERHKVVFTGANADPGGSVIDGILREHAQKHPDRFRLFQSLGLTRYMSAVSYADCVVGNSSSGIIEVPSMGVPVVDIGIRQAGRLSSSSVLHCQPDADSIEKSLRQALSAEHRKLAKNAPNPYHGENTSGAMASILAEYPLDGILVKKFYDYAE